MRKIILSLFLILFLPSIALAPVWPIKTRASQVRANTSNFDVNLSTSDTDVQKALDTLDDLNYVDKAGDTMSGNLTVPQIIVSTITSPVGEDLIIKPYGTQTLKLFASTMGLIGFYDPAGNFKCGFNDVFDSFVFNMIDDPYSKVTFMDENNIEVASIDSDGNATVGSLSSSGQVTSNGNKLIDVYDWAVVITTPTWLGTDAVLISPIRSFAVTITTITMITTGGTNFIGMIEQRAYASPHNAGTDIWSGDVTVSSTTWTTGAVSDYTVPANYGLYLVPTSVSGPVKILTLRGIISKD